MQDVHVSLRGDQEVDEREIQQGLLNNQTLSLPWEVLPDGWRLGEYSGSVLLKALHNLSTLPWASTFATVGEGAWG